MRTINMKTVPFLNKAKLISKYHSNKNIEGLEKLLIIHDDNSETYDVYDKLNKLVIRCCYS